MAHAKTRGLNQFAKKRFKNKYLSTMQARRLLQVDSMTFRKLCILKGIYPRSIRNNGGSNRGGRSKQKDSGRSKCYYLTREIKWLVHDDVHSRIGDFAAWEKNVRRAKAQHRHETLKLLESNKRKPSYRLDSTIRERFPTFAEALRDVDDAMSMVSLYAALSPEVYSESTIELHQALPSGLHAKAKTLVQDWMDYVAKSHSLCKSFISIKGFYHEAVVSGERIVWLMPHEYACRVPTNVQQYVLVSFLEFYVELMRFILFKLKKDLDRELEQKALEEDQLAAAQEEGESSGNNKQEDFDKLADIGAVSSARRRAEAGRNKFMQQWRDARGKIAVIFKGLTFYISREVPHKQCKMVIEACGGAVLENYDARRVTHFIVDRPALPPGFAHASNIEYVQPQWVFDSLNARIALPVQNAYRMGDELPAHVSPFTVAMSSDPFDIAEVEQVRKEHPKLLGYVPQRVHEIRRIKDPLYVAADAAGKPLAGAAASAPGADDDDDDDSVASEEARIALAPTMGAGDVELDDAELAALPRRRKWEDETVAELPTRSAVSALKVLKQRELNQLNRPTSDAEAQRRADLTNSQIARLRAEPASKRVARKAKQQKADEAARERMKLQVTRKKAARYYRMIKGTQRGVEKKEQILAHKASALQRGSATVTGQERDTFTSAKEVREAAQLEKNKQSSNPQKRRQAMRSEQKKKAKADPYRKLPVWTR